MRGGFSVELINLREQLVRFAALIELELDFAMEDVEFADRKTFYEALKESTQLTNKLLNSFVLGNVIRNGVSVAIIGKPNAGKSTLLNTLLNEERAIVSDIAGTTRDTIEETINIHGILFRLIDTAGIRDGVVDSIEHIGIEKSLEKMKQANLVVYLFDVNTEGNEDLKEKEVYFKQEGIRYLLVANKVDSEDQENKLASSDHQIVKLSAKHKRGIDDLKMSIYNHAIHGKINPDQTIVTNLRHHQALTQIIKSIDAIHQGLDEKISGDLLAIEIRTCLFHLGEITGEISNEDKLDYIFSKFCIGK
jgi:tRNA modification GTPase